MSTTAILMYGDNVLSQVQCCCDIGEGEHLLMYGVLGSCSSHLCLPSGKLLPNMLILNKHYCNIDGHIVKHLTQQHNIKSRIAGD